MTPRISVITPCLDAAATLPETLASVRSQSRPAHEHIVVDGGSTDGTVEVLTAADGVRWVSEPDRGLVDAFNKGVAMATGDVVGWLNADDVYRPAALERAADAFERNPGAVWVTGRCAIVDGSGREIRRPIAAYKDFFLRRYSYRLHLVQNFVAAPATFVARAPLLEMGGLDERFRYSMDYDLWLRLGRIAPPVVVDEELAAFRMAGESLSMSGFERQFEEHTQNAREHGQGHRIAVAANRTISTGIVSVYRALRTARTLRS